MGTTSPKDQLLDPGVMGCAKTRRWKGLNIIIPQLLRISHAAKLSLTINMGYYRQPTRCSNTVLTARRELHIALGPPGPGVVEPGMEVLYAGNVTKIRPKFHAIFGNQFRPNTKPIQSASGHVACCTVCQACRV